MANPILQPVGTGAYDLAEIAVELIEAQIKANIAQALANVRAHRVDSTVTTEPPREYFQYAMAHVYRAPAIFTIIQDMDIQSDLTKANHINGLNQIVVAAVVEDRLQRLVVRKAWRYQAALMQCLHEVSLTSADGTLRLFSRVKRCSFSGEINLKDEKAADAVFRKEMTLKLQVEHIENLE